MHSLHTGRLLVGEWKVFPNVWWWLLGNLHVLGFFNCCEETQWPQHIWQRKHLIEVVAYSFRGSVHYHHDRGHGSNQTVCGAGYILTRGSTKLSDCYIEWILRNRPQSPPTVTHFFQQDHIYCNRTTTPYSVTPFGNHFLSNHHIPFPDAQRLVDIS